MHANFWSDHVPVAKGLLPKTRESKHGLQKEFLQFLNHTLNSFQYKLLP